MITPITRSKEGIIFDIVITIPNFVNPTQAGDLSMKTATFYDASSPGGLAHRPTAASPLQPAAAAQLPQWKVDVRVSVCWLAQYRLVLVALVSKMQSSEVHSAKTHYHCEIPASTARVQKMPPLLLLRSVKTGYSKAPPEEQQ